MIKKKRKHLLYFSLCYSILYLIIMSVSIDSHTYHVEMVIYICLSVLLVLTFTYIPDLMLVARYLKLMSAE